MDINLYSGGEGRGGLGKRQSVLSTVTPCELSVTRKLPTQKRNLREDEKMKVSQNLLAGNEKVPVSLQV